PKQHRNPETVNQPRQYVATAIVGAEPVDLELVALSKAVTCGKLAVFFCQHPCGLGWKRRRRFAHLRVVGKTNGRPDYGAAFFLDEAYQVFVPVVRSCAEQAWVVSFGKGRIRVCEDSREIETAVYMNKNRLVVGDEFSEQRHQKQRKKNP